MIFPFHFIISSNFVYCCQFILTFLNFYIFSNDCFFLFFEFHLEIHKLMIILSSLTSKIFFKHLILINDFQKFVFNSVKFSLQFLDIILFTSLELFHDFFLSIEFSFNIFTFGHGFICTSLELFILLLKDV